jgi:hypothetical protein
LAIRRTANRRTSNLNEGISMILPKPKNLQLREFHQFIQTMKFKNQDNSFESIGALCGPSSRTPLEKKIAKKIANFIFLKKIENIFPKKKENFFSEKNSTKFSRKNLGTYFRKRSGTFLVNDEISGFFFFSFLFTVFYFLFSCAINHLILINSVLYICSKGPSLIS